jgi:hypothetical protein
MDAPVAVVQSILKEESIIKLLSLAGVKVRCELSIDNVVPRMFLPSLL